MSGLMGLFGKSQNLDAASFKYNPNKQKRQVQPKQQSQQHPQTQQSQSQIPNQFSIFLYLFDNVKNENISYGQLTLLIRELQHNNYQLIIFQQQSNPIINFQIVSAVSWTIRDQVYAYLRDPQGRQWTIRFNDANTAAKATELMSKILTSIKESQPQSAQPSESQPQTQPQSSSNPQQNQQPPKEQQQQKQVLNKKPKQHEHQNLFDNNDDDDNEPVINTTYVPTVDEEDILKRLDQLGDFVRSKFDSLVLEAPVTLNPQDLIYEVQNLASQIEDQERQLKEQEQLIDELRQSKQNNRLKAELDIAQTELQSLRSVLKGGKDYRRENDRLKTELRQVKDEELSTLQIEFSDLKRQLANAHEISQVAAQNKTKEMFFSFMGSALDKLKSLYASNQTLDSKMVSDQIYEVFHQCSDDIFRQIDQEGII